MKKLFNIKTNLLLMIITAIFSFGLTSCSDDDSSSGGTPVITGVRVCDPEKADSLFTKSSQGQVIAIIGENLGNTVYVYINDQKVYFNPTFNTDHSVIVTVPTEADGFKLTAFNSNLKDEIRVETSHGTATYAFKVHGGYPSISRIQAMYPRQAGDILEVYGMNLESIEAVYFTDIEAAVLDTTEWETPGGNHVNASYEYVVNNHYLNTKTQAYETESQLAVTIPEMSFENGTLVIQTAAGYAYVPYYKYPGKPTITSISSDMPQIGEIVSIKGTEFVQVESVTYGDVTLTASDITVADTEDEITFTFSKKPTNGSGTTISITTPGGTVTSDRFYDYTTLLTSFDDDAINNGWDPDAQYIDGGDADGKYAYINTTEYQQWWGKMVYYRKDWSGGVFTFSENIPSTASTDELYLAFNAYDLGDYNNGTFWGYIRYMIQPGAGGKDTTYDNFDWEDYASGIGKFPDGPTLQNIDGENLKGQWYRVVVPLSKFSCYSGKTLADIASAGISQFRLQSINQDTDAGKVDLKIDNVRVIYIPNK